jgi:alanyl-tRNA synthetase
MISTAEVRQKFLDYFQQKQHQLVPSSPLVPANDPTLLFTNAGMVQFKDVFLGAEKRPYTRATSSQRCVRAGGKHNDLENVGYTARHHTFFEMLGNFSFGDYFKKEAIEFAWEFLTRELGLPAEKLWITVYADDDEAADIWLNHIGVDPDRFTRIGDKPGGKRYESDNFWAMGDTGPCGPCTEIFYDHGPEIAGDPPGTPEEDGDRYIEIWNLVFMQYDRQADGEMRPLPKPSVDTGMGLERITSILQGVHNNYDIDLFQHLIRFAADLLAVKDTRSASLKVIADHIRACAFLIVDGVLPANEGRGYVLRRIIRRAARHGHKLGAREPFFYRMVQPLVEVMGDAYPELVKNQALVEQVLKQEEERFAETLDTGMQVFARAVENLEGDTIPGDVAFKLYDTYGFPLDLTQDVAREKGLKVDEAGFQQAMQAQKQRSRSAGQFKTGASMPSELMTRLPATEFLGYDSLQANGGVLAILQDGQPVESLQAGESGVVILDKTPFYAESGGQVGDTGMFRWAGGEATVTDTQKVAGQFHAHAVTVTTGELREDETVEAIVDATRRDAIRLNHTATHLLHRALKDVLGEHVQQKGSLVAPDRLRFDFSHFQPISTDELAEIERQVNAAIRRDLEAQTKVLSYDEAINSGAVALFGEKYGDRVRVLDIGGYSVELCGGTHVSHTGQIGLFKITQEGSVASGVRRIEAVTGEKALQHVQQRDALLAELTRLVNAPPEKLGSKLQQLIQQHKQLEKNLASLQQKLASQAAGAVWDEVETQGDRAVLTKVFTGFSVPQLRDMVDQFKQKFPQGIVVLANFDNGKAQLIAGVGKPLTNQFRAGDIIRQLAQSLGGRGGGRPDMAQGGAETDKAALETALQALKQQLLA